MAPPFPRVRTSIVRGSRESVAQKAWRRDGACLNISGHSTNSNPMRRLFAMATCVAGVALLSLGPQVSPAVGQSQAVAFVGATVIDGSGSGPISDALVLVEDGRIVYVGPVRAFDESHFERIDTRGKWITPGLIDTNVHLILTTVPEFFVKYEDRLEDIAIQSAQVGLKFGMTTMADTWGPLDPLLSARDRIRSGEFAASDVLVAGNIIGTGGPFSGYFMGGWPLRGSTLRYGGWVHEDIRRRIDDLWEAGVGPELLAMTQEEVGIAIREYIFSREALAAITAETRRAGIPLQTHTFSVESLRLAIEMEPDLLQHPNVMSRGWSSASGSQQEAIRLMIEDIRGRGILSGLMAIPERDQIEIYQGWTPEQSGGNEALNEIMLRRQQWYTGVAYDDLAEGLRVWLEAGVPYTIATDQGPESADLGPTVWGRLGRAHFGRMKGLQDAGAAPMDVLVAATRNGAAAYGLLDDRGTLERGKRADLLVLDADPMLDIDNMRRIRLVMKNGSIIDREALPTVRVLDYDPSLPWPR
jgi:imidazolonepropionase-like amidohydrolase